MVAAVCIGVVTYKVQAEIKTISPADFGAIVNDGLDDTEAVRQALAKVKQTGGVVQFEPGRYDFFKSSADKANYPVTAVHLQWDFATPFHLNSFKNVTLDGSGSTFIFHGRMTPFVLNDCKNVCILPIPSYCSML